MPDRHPKGKVIRREIDDFASRLVIIPWDEIAADHYGAIRAALKKAGTLVGAMDMLIAAHAISCGAALVTNQPAGVCANQGADGDKLGLTANGQ